MKKKFASLLLALALCLGLIPAASAAPTVQSGIMTDPNVATWNEPYIHTDGSFTYYENRLPGEGYKSLAQTSQEDGLLLLREDGTLWRVMHSDLNKVLFEPAYAARVPLEKVLDGVVQLQPGMALKEDGSVWTDIPLPPDYDAAKPAGYAMYHLMDDVRQIYSRGSGEEGMAVKTDGSLWTWGFHYGDFNPWLGREVDGSAPHDWYAPAKIMANVAYATYTMAIKTDGTLWSWGSNEYGGVGNGSDRHQLTPVKVLDNVIGAWWSGGSSSAVRKYAMTTDGSLYSWGDNTYGHLGYAGGSKSHTVENPLGLTDTFYYQDTPRRVEVSGVVTMQNGYVQKADGSLWYLSENGLGEKLADDVKLPSGVPVPSPAGFTDVKAGDYFADAVKWAVGNDITTGAAPTKFAPSRTCTCAEILTFLWRTADEPESDAELPIVLPASLGYAENAIRWAAERGMVDSSFNLSAPCTRAGAVTYIWQAFDSPAAEDSGFSDVPAGAGYAQAVAWAVELGVTEGMGDGKFSPDKICNRGQIVTFLHRAYVPEARLPVKR